MTFFKAQAAHVTRKVIENANYSLDTANTLYSEHVKRGGAALSSNPLRPFQTPLHSCAEPYWLSTAEERHLNQFGLAD